MGWLQPSCAFNKDGCDAVAGRGYSDLSSDGADAKAAIYGLGTETEKIG